ncbi:MULTISPECIES: pyrroloquinoline quinone biosynthesis peptide chaperone PqqD [unclassified Streptomyces]|uniref:pyrroloquinoline quinone biosynthesis peptide chaperone PqqD n=1 Tax=unclassified Streptomyces TaxID=2593676 RepID=UPI003FD02FAE
MSAADGAVEGAAEGAEWRPALAPGVLFRYDPVRRAVLLVLPERVVVLNTQAGGVIRLCDGRRAVGEIVEVLAARHPGAPVATEVPDFLHRVREEGWLR